MRELFKSQTSYEIIDLLVNNKEKSFYLAEIAKKLCKDIANTTRELTRLVDQGIVQVKTKNDKKYYSFNKKSPAAKELAELFKKLKKSDFQAKFKTKWMLAEDIPNLCPFFSQIWLNAFVDEFEEPGGRAYKKIAAVFKDYHLWFYYDEKDACEVGEHLVNNFFSEPGFMDMVNKEIIKQSDKLREYVEKLPEEALSKYSNKELWEFYETHEDIHTEYYQCGWIPVAADMFCNNLTNRGKKILRELGVSEEDIDNYLVMLTTPAKPSLLKIEDDELMQIAIQVQKDNQQFKLFKELFVKFKEEDVKKFGLYTHSPEYEKKFEEIVKDMKKQIRPEILDALQKHYAKYFYTKFLFTEERGVYSFEHYLKTLVRLVNSDADLKAAFEKQEKEFQEAVGERENLIKKLKLKKDLIEFFDAWGDFMVTKIYRRYAQLFAIYKMVPIIEEIGRRIGLTIKQTKFMTSEEIERALFGGAFNAEEVKGRVKFSVYYADKNEHTFYSGDEAKRAAELVQTQDIEQVDEIKGQCGCQGEARGIVKIINVVEDMQKMKKGDILVSISTQPDLVPAMKRAAAFVTEQGGVTSHAAIVARELKIPCVIGTKIATRVLKDGDEVEVDATHGTVKIIKKA